MRIADSRGIETIGYRIEQLSESINKFINVNLHSGNPDQFVHCIWYCLKDTRFEDIEEETLEELSKIYKSNSIPIIIVYTQAINDEYAENMEKIIKEKGKYDFIPILAKKVVSRRNVIEPFGINELKEISVKRAREAVKISYYENYIIQTSKETKNQLKEINAQLDSFIKDKVKTKLDMMSEGKSDKEICDDLKNLLFNLISHNIYNETRSYISINSENLIIDFSKNIINDELKKSFKTKFDEYIKQKTDDICKEIKEGEYSQISSFNLNDNDIKNIINGLIGENKLLYEKLYQRAWILYIKNYIENICNYFVKELKDNSEKIYNEILIHEDFKNCIKNLVQKRFDEIEEQLKL